MRELSRPHRHAHAAAAAAAGRASGWTAEQTRQNFEAVSRVMTPGDVMKSPLARAPAGAGGRRRRTAHRRQVLDVAGQPGVPGHCRVGAAPLRRARRQRRGRPPLDFEFFKTRIQPIFLAKRPGHARCITCHESGTPRLIAAAGGRRRPGPTSSRARTSRRGSGSWCPATDRRAASLMHPLAKSRRRRSVPCRRQALAVAEATPNGKRSRPGSAARPAGRAAEPSHRRPRTPLLEVDLIAASCCRAFMG